MTRGHKGEVPALVPWVRAAKYLGMPTTDLLARDDGVWLRNEALSLLRIEADAEEAHAKIRARQRRR